MAGTASEARSLSDDLFGPFLGGPGEPGAHPSLAQAASAHLGHSGNRLLAAECLVGGSAPMPVPVPTEGSVRGGSAWPVAWGAALPDVPFGAALGDGFAGSTRGLGAARGSGGGDAGGASSGGGRAGLHSGDSSGRSGEPGGAKPASPPATSSKSFKELHAERNKQAQRRFRQRQKARECGSRPLVPWVRARARPGPLNAAGPARAGEDGGAAVARGGGGGPESRAHQPLQGAGADAAGARRRPLCLRASPRAAGGRPMLGDWAGAQLRKEELRQLRQRQAAPADAEEDALAREFAGSVTLTFREDRTVTLTPAQARRGRCLSGRGSAAEPPSLRQRGPARPCARQRRRARPAAPAGARRLSPGRRARAD